MTCTVMSLFLCELHGGSANSGKMTNRRCVVNAESLCEGPQPPQVLPLPVWDNTSTRITHVDEFMSSIMSTVSTRRPIPKRQ